jgi:hypothetical protein
MVAVPLLPTAVILPLEETVATDKSLDFQRRFLYLARRG